VTKFTIRAMPTVPMSSWSGIIPHSNDANITWDAITMMHARWPSLASIGAGGYMVGKPGMTGGQTSLHIFQSNSSTPDVLQTALNPIIAEISNVTNSMIRISGVYGQHSSQAAYQQEMLARGGEGGNSAPRPLKDGKDSDPIALSFGMLNEGNGKSKIVSSWLYSAQALGRPGLKMALRNSVDETSTFVNDMTSGPGVHKHPFGIRGGSNAVNPGWRKSLMRVASEQQWSGSELTQYRAKKASSLQFTKSLQELDPELGTYLNEADPQTPNFRQAFWGSNYPRLLSFKRLVDPDGVFYCQHCVGSEDWEMMPSGDLCRKA
jgi:hypothetical protein